MTAQRKWLRRLAIAAVSLACSAPHAELVGVPRLQPDAERQDGFRKRFPEPAGLADMVATYRKANAILLERSKDGAVATVDLTYPDGSTGVGRDVYFSSEPRMLREERPDYEGILIADRGCIRYTGAAWRCDALEFNLGLRELHPDGVVGAVEDRVPCNDGTCTRLSFVEARDTSPFEEDAVEGDGHAERWADPDPERARYELLLVVRANGEPVEFTEAEYVDGALHGPKATFHFELDAEVAPLVLPQSP